MNGRSKDHAERVCALALEIVELLPVPAASALDSAAVADVRAEAAIAAWRLAEREPSAFAGPHGEPDRARIAGYLRKALLKSLDHLARRRREDQALRSADELGVASDFGREIVEREQDLTLARAVRRLPRGQREVVERRLEGRSFARIAAELGIRRATAIQRYSRARRALPGDVRGLLPPPHARGR
jgi:DNA-directed RNA polymerase specialized sigma24 family protein